MANFKAVTRTNKEYNTVYIRITHGAGRVDYIKTNMSVHKSGIRKGEITDHTVLANCALKIKSYVDKINQTNIDNWTVQELRKYLTSDLVDISFSDFARKYIEKMLVSGRKEPSVNYCSALKSIEKYYGKKINFQEITSKELRNWIDSLSETKRAKELYPVLIKKMFEDGCMEFNDYDRNIIKIPNQPFRAVKIPKADIPKKRSIERDTIRKIFDYKTDTGREELAQDVSKMILSLAGINTVDLYNLKKESFTGGKICYNRKKTEKLRRDKAYVEIGVPNEILYLFEKYKGRKSLFVFPERYSEERNFVRAVNTGLKSICEKIEILNITSYWFRHSWATIAQNHCGASTEMVAFCLNHSSAHRVTEGYIKKDFSPIDELNRKVLDYVFT